jgi:cytochrome b6-f complex iron-sulfur subunit
VSTKESDKLNRRDVLLRIAGTTAVVAVPSGVLSFALGCSKTGGTNSTADLNGISIPNSSSNLYFFDFATYPALAYAGGSARFTVAATGGTKVVSVVRYNSSVAYTVSAICTHQSCTLNLYSSASQTFVCPCHGAVFSAAGTPVSGPAFQSLAAYSTSISGSGIAVSIP